jgi:AraC-like DNA-binding protein
VIVQWTRREHPEHGVFYRRVIYRHPLFCVCVVRSSAIVHDWEIQAELVSFIARLARPQLTILLAGRGYFMTPAGPRLLSSGDLVESDQSLREFEGYGGSPCECILLEWEDDTIFGRARRGPARFSRLGLRDVAVLRSLVARVEELPPAIFVGELARTLAALGQEVVLGADLDPPVPRSTKRIFAAIGEAISRLGERPSLSEVATHVELTERQTNRHFKELSEGYAHPNATWREFIHDARVGAATQFLAVPGIPIGRVAQLSGYGSSIALCHAFALRGAPSPGELARRLAERWW